jgi:hypothetical protein
MAKKSDVTLTLSGLSGVTPVGVTISYAAGGVPTATVDLAPAPPGVIKIEGKPSGILENVDAQKRQNDVTIDISVSTFTGTIGDRKISKLKFVGLLDGLSIGNVVGGNTYQAVLKNKAQRLLELTTMTPGLHPSSINVYKVPIWGVTTDPDQGDNKAMRSWAAIQGGSDVNFDQSPIQTYTDVMKWIISNQESGWRRFLATENLASGDFPFAKIFDDPRYKKALNEAKQLFNNVDYSAVVGGASKNASAIKPLVMKTMGSIFASGPNVLLENYMNFLANMGCTLIFSNSKMFVVPVNSVINQEYIPPSKRKLQERPNAAYPADYNSYIYNDTGYRDIASVIVTIEGYTGGTYIGGASFERGATVHYTAPASLSNASGVLVVQASPFMVLSATAPIADDVKESRQKFDQAKESMMPELDKLKYSSYKGELTSQIGTSEKKKKTVYQDYLKNVLTNYAETKFYQERFHDRRGSITMDFNPDWVPGTSGSLYIRETEMFIAFYVTEVNHRIDMSPLNSGSAMTVVNFSCGRMGAKPLGVDRDEYLGYDLSKEKAVQQAFIADNK